MQPTTAVLGTTLIPCAQLQKGVPLGVCFMVICNVEYRSEMKVNVNEKP
jgi:hypothetical protein